MADNRLNKRWQKLCEDIAAEARRQGASEPFIFACESGLVVLDGPPFADATQVARQDAVLFILPSPPSSVATFDAGGW